ncbi:MAG: IPTL-CTERM sorting domain-containing protein [Desulfobacteraceae bacterium]|nr:MAG: IPTL-CTERM sorting domain-containing protein [Desulfobacteraceae bacterium]
MFHAKKNILNQMIMFGLLVSVGFATLLYGASPIMAADAPDLGTAGTFGVLADTYTNTVAGTTINGDLGYTTGPAVTPTVNGTTHVADGTYDQAGLDQSSALADLNGQSCISLGTGAVNLDTIDIGSGPGVFTPGCYSSGGAMNITVNQTVTLSGPGVYIFRPGGALTTGADTQIVLDGDICEYDVFWAPAGATTIGANTDFVGNILDPAGITIGANATLEGRALGFGGTVTTDTNLITVPVCPLISAKLGLLKTIDNTGGGTATVDQFTLTATGNPWTGPTIVTGTSPVTAIDAPVGVYTITETGPDGYVAAFSVSGGGTLVGNNLTITEADAGNTIIVTIHNTYVPAIAAKLGLLKTIDNTGGGTATAGQFTLTATGDASTGPTIVTGTSPVTAVDAPVGVYTITETGPNGYIGTFSVSGGGTLAGNILTITEADAGKTIIVTIHNTYVPAIAAKLGLQKTIDNTGGGTATTGQFTLTATGNPWTGPTIVTGTSPVTAVNVPVGVYAITETGPDGYIGTFSVSGGGTLVGNNLTITEADAGKTIIVTIHNTYVPGIAAKLGLLKTIDNTGGGTATAGQFTLIATGDASTGSTIVTGTSPVTAVNVPVGVYTITETGPDGYIGTFSVSGGGALVGNKLTITEADAGKTITVTTTNTYVPAIATKLGLLKTVNGGTAKAVDFTLTATGDTSTGSTIVTGTTPVTAVNVPVGVYTITETGPVGYTAGFTVSGGTLAGNKLTITAADAGKTIIITVANTFSPIPTLSEWGMIILMMLAGLTFMYSLKKRKETI